MKLAAYFQVHGIKTSPNWLTPPLEIDFTNRFLNTNHLWDITGDIDFFITWNKAVKEWIDMTVGIPSYLQGSKRRKDLLDDLIIHTDLGYLEKDFPQTVERLRSMRQARGNYNENIFLDKDGNKIPPIKYINILESEIIDPKQKPLFTWYTTNEHDHKLCAIDERLSLFPEYLGYRAEMYREVHKEYMTIGGVKGFGLLFIDAKPNGFYSFDGWLESKGYKHLIF